MGPLGGRASTRRGQHDESGLSCARFSMLSPWDNQLACNAPPYRRTGLAWVLARSSCEDDIVLSFLGRQVIYRVRA